MQRLPEYAQSCHVTSDSGILDPLQCAFRALARARHSLLVLQSRNVPARCLPTDHGLFSLFARFPAFIAANACNDNKESSSRTKTEKQPWWELDLGQARSITQVKVMQHPADGELTLRLCLRFLTIALLLAAFAHVVAWRVRVCREVQGPEQGLPVQHPAQHPPLPR